MEIVRRARTEARDAGYHALIRGVNFLLRLPGHSLRLGALRIAGCSVGAGTAVERGVTLSTRGRVAIGAGSNVNRGTLLDGRGGLAIGEQVNISPEVMLLTAEHDFRSPDFA